MKKSILLFTGALTSLFSMNAQQTITGTSGTGYSITFAAATPATASTVPIGTTGANVTWNCSNLATSNQIFTLNLSSPSTQPYFSDYPTSNLSLNASVMGTLVVNDFLILNSDSLVKLGGHVAGNSYEIYSNPQMEFKFPFNYTDVVVNTYAKTSYNANGSVSSTQTGSVTLSYEGYGTLVLPVGTFTNVAMVKRIRTNSIGPTTTSYSWVKYPSGERLLEWDGNNGPKVSYVYAMSTSGLQDLFNDNVTHLYPSITSGLINFSSEKEIEAIHVYDASGRLINAAVTQNNNSYSIEISGNKGLFFVEAVGKNNSFRTVRKVILD